MGVPDTALFLPGPAGLYLVALPVLMSLLLLQLNGGCLVLYHFLCLDVRMCVEGWEYQVNVNYYAWAIIVWQSLLMLPLVVMHPWPSWIFD